MPSPPVLHHPLLTLPYPPHTRQDLHSKLEATFGPAQPPSEAEVAAAVQQLVAADLLAAGQQASAPLAQGPAAAGAPASAAAECAQPGGDGPEQVQAAAAPLSVPKAAWRGGRAGLAAAAAALSALD